MKMKTLSCSIALIIAVALASPALASNTKEYQKEIHKEFSISSDGEVEINNKYGHIDVVPGSGSSVIIDVIITVDAKSEDKANEVFERVDINFSNTSSYVKAETEINTAKGWNKWWNDGDKFEISYKVQVPSTVSLDLENKYGDIYVGQKENDAEIVIKYGNLRMDGITGDLNLDMGYGKGSITSAGEMALNMKYSSLTCGNLGDVTATTKYSGFKADEVGNLRTNTSYDNYDVGGARAFTNIGKYDDFKFGHVHAVDMDTKYSHLSAKRLSDRAVLNLKYGGVSIDMVDESFSEIDINSEYAGIKLTVAPNASFTVDVQGSHAGVKHDNLEVYIDKQSSGGSMEVKGFRGSRDASSSITANLRYGSIKVY